MGTSLKGKNLLPEGAIAPRGIEFFPLRAVSDDMEITFATIGDLPQ